MTLKRKERTMNICYLSGENPVLGHGGVDTVAVVLTRGFESLGHKVFHVAWTHNERSGDESFGKNLPCTFLPDDSRFNSKNNAAFFRKFLVENEIDAIIYSWGIGKKYPFPGIAKNARSTPIPVAAIFHNQPDYYKIRYAGAGLFHALKMAHRAARQRGKYRWNFDNCDALVLLTEGFRSTLEQHLRADQIARSRQKIFAIGNPATFPPQEIDFSKKKKELLMVGLGWSSKRPYLLLDAWQKIQTRFPDWALRFLGGGDDLEKLRAHAEKIQSQRVFFEGFQKPEKFYRDASIFCMTSAYEGFPMVLPEATTFGCVPVAFDSFAAARDIISDGENGALVPAFDLDAYAETLARLMSDDAERERLARAAQRDSARFSVETTCQKWLALFKILNGKNDE